MGHHKIILPKCFKTKAFKNCTSSFINKALQNILNRNLNNKVGLLTKLSFQVPCAKAI